MADKTLNENDLLNRVINSIFFRSSLSKASRVSRNAQGLLELIKRVLSKTRQLGAGGVFDLIREKVVIIGKLIKSYATGEYRDIDLKNLIILIAGLVYFLSPLDFIPDLIPLLGYADDIALLTFVLRRASDEVEKFELWELNKNI